MICKLVIPGRAIPAIRMNSKMKRTKRNMKYMRYRNQIGWIARSEHTGPPTQCDVGVNVNVYLNGGVQGDVDNYFKTITDSMNKIVYADDRQIREMSARKIESEDERVEIVVYKM